MPSRSQEQAWHDVLGRGPASFWPCSPFGSRVKGVNTSGTDSSIDGLPGYEPSLETRFELLLPVSGPCMMLCKQERELELFFRQRCSFHQSSLRDARFASRRAVDFRLPSEDRVSIHCPLESDRQHPVRRTDRIPLTLPSRLTAWSGFQ